MGMEPHSRRAAILERAGTQGEVSVDALAESFGVSTMTIRRDLAQLAGEGRLRRTHGGAVLTRAGVAEFRFLEKENVHAAEKRAIARVTAARVEPGMRLSLDTGTTTLEVARLLPPVGNLTVLTSSLAIASVLHTAETVEVVLLGGTVRRHNPDLCGPLAEENLRRFRVDIAVIGADAVTPDGTFTADLSVSAITRTMAEQADRVILAADHSKFERSAFYRCVPLNQLHEMVTDNGCPPAVRRRLARVRAKVMYARVG